jgi:hypothetical protein
MKKIETNTYASCDIPAKTIIRYTTAPTKYDIAPYGTICTLYLNDDGTNSRLYIQTSSEEQDPVWLTLEQVVIQAYKPLFSNPCFIQDCLEKSLANNQN